MIGHAGPGALAICRTNRRWTNPVTGQEKHFGLIVDYVGLGAEIAKSLRAADPEKGGRRPVDAEGLLVEFEAAIELALVHFEGIDRSDFSFAALAAAQDRLPPGETRDTFAREFLTVHHLWEFLDPHPTLAARRADYRWLAQGTNPSSRQAAPTRSCGTASESRRSAWCTVTSVTSP